MSFYVQWNLKICIAFSDLSLFFIKSKYSFVLFFQHEIYSICIFWSGNPVSLKNSTCIIHVKTFDILAQFGVGDHFQKEISSQSLQFICQFNILLVQKVEGFKTISIECNIQIILYTSKLGSGLFFHILITETTRTNFNPSSTSSLDYLLK